MPPTSAPKEPLVFVVDEDPHVNLLITATMKLAKCNTMSFHSTDECLNGIDKFASELDIACIDGKLAEEGGGLIISRIKQANPDAKVLVIASNDSARSQILRYGADDFLMKPTSAITIMEKILLLAAMKGVFGR
jgi:FixJ family two-component response regulator